MFIMKNTFSILASRRFASNGMNIILGIMICIGIHSCNEFNFEAQKFYTQNILNPILEQPYVNIEYKIIEDVGFFSESQSYTKKIMKNDSLLAFTDGYATHWNYLFGRDYFKYIGNEEMELMNGKKNANLLLDIDAYKDGGFFYSADWCFRRYVENRATDFLSHFYMQNKSMTPHVMFDNIFDTTINNVGYTVISYDDKTHYYYNEATEEFNIPNFYTVSYYYNNVEKRLQYIFSTPMDYPNNGAKEAVKIELNITFDDNRNIIDSVFNFEHEMYKNYSCHNNTDSLPLSWIIDDNKKQILNDTVLDYPIVSMVDGSITTIRQQKGWTLIDFWNTGCRPCYETMEMYSKCKADVSLEYMKEHNVNFLMVNPRSGNVDLLLQRVGHYGVNHILYHSKGFGSVFAVKVFPTILLVSPDKKTFYRLESLKELPKYIEVE